MFLKQSTCFSYKNHQFFSSLWPIFIQSFYIFFKKTSSFSLKYISFKFEMYQFFLLNCCIELSCIHICMHVTRALRSRLYAMHYLGSHAKTGQETEKLALNPNMFSKSSQFIQESYQFFLEFWQNLVSHTSKYYRNLINWLQVLQYF